MHGKVSQSHRTGPVQEDIHTQALHLRAQSEKEILELKQ